MYIYEEFTINLHKMKTQGGRYMYIYQFSYIIFIFNFFLYFRDTKMLIFSFSPHLTSPLHRGLCVPFSPAKAFSARSWILPGSRSGGMERQRENGKCKSENRWGNFIKKCVTFEWCVSGGWAREGFPLHFALCVIYQIREG